LRPGDRYTTVLKNSVRISCGAKKLGFTESDDSLSAYRGEKIYAYELLCRKYLICAYTQQNAGLKSQGVRSWKKQF
jgi:hypothetical protein